jgi:hypothetical protein
MRNLNTNLFGLVLALIIGYVKCGMHLVSMFCGFVSKVVDIVVW